MSVLTEGRSISHGHPSGVPGRKPTVCPAGQAPKDDAMARRDALVTFIKEHLPAMCAEYVQFKQTGILDDDLIRGCIRDATWAPGDIRMSLVLGILSDCAVASVASM